jgi:hypothetical protein
MTRRRSKQRGLSERLVLETETLVAQRRWGFKSLDGVVFRSAQWQDRNRVAVRSRGRQLAAGSSAGAARETGLRLDCYFVIDRIVALSSASSYRTARLGSGVETAEVKKAHVIGRLGGPGLSRCRPRNLFHFSANCGNSNSIRALVDESRYEQRDLR